MFHDHEGIYTGRFEEGLQQGYGEYKYNDGTSYAGQFKEGERHGKGKIVWQDGSFYEGAWAEGVQHGAGEEVVRGGSPRAVKYTQGKREKLKGKSPRTDNGV